MHEVPMSGDGIVSGHFVDPLKSEVSGALVYERDVHAAELHVNE